MKNMFITIRLIVLIFSIKFYQAQFAPPQIESIQRIRLNAFRVRWSVPNSANYQLTRNRVLLYDGTTSTEWPSQAVRVNKDGDDALEVDRYSVSSYLECVKFCLANPKCQFVVRSGQMCFLKASTPTNSLCAPKDECAVVLSYSSEANLYELPMNKTFRLQVQVYDMNSKNWSAPSQLSDYFSTNLLKPQMVNTFDMLVNNTVRVSWTVPDPTIINPTRYLLSVYRYSFNDVKEWPAQMKQSGVDGSATQYVTYSSATTSSAACKSFCLKDARCLLAIRDTKYCYLKDYPKSPTTCGYASGCWMLKDYTSFADLYHLPFNDMYKFQVSIYDQYSETWSLPADFSTDLNLVVNISLAVMQLDDFSYKIKLNQNFEYHPIVRYRLLVSKNGSDYAYDSTVENNLKAMWSSSPATNFNSDASVNQGNVGNQSECLRLCAQNFGCVGVKIQYNLCYTAFKFDPYTWDDCGIYGDQCFSIMNTATEFVMTNVDASTTYNVKLQYYTKYNSTGYSDIASFNTTRILVGIHTTDLLETKPATLTCITPNSSIVSQVIWSKDDIILQNFQQSNIQIDDTKRTLSFTNLSRFYDNGRYTCSIRLTTNKQLLTSEPFYLIAKYGPLFTDLYANNSHFRYNISDNARFMCSAEGYGPFKFGWLFNANETRSLDNIAFSNYSNQTFKYYAELNFKNFTRADNGNYSCMVDTHVISRLSISVPAPPSKPRLVYLKSYNETAFFINWKLDDNGDYPVTGIDVQWKDNSGTKNGFSRSISMNDYFNGTVFNVQIPDGSTVQIRLQNALGNSDFSDPVKYLITSIAANDGGMSTQTLIIAIVVPIVVLIIIAIIVVVWIRKRRVKITKI